MSESLEQEIETCHLERKYLIHMMDVYYTNGIIILMCMNAILSHTGINRLISLK